MPDGDGCVGVLFVLILRIFDLGRPRASLGRPLLHLRRLGRTARVVLRLVLLGLICLVAS